MKADATALRAAEWIWWGQDRGIDRISFGRWPSDPCQMRYVLAVPQATEHDHDIEARDKRRALLAQQESANG